MAAADWAGLSTASVETEREKGFLDIRPSGEY
jgi:hypothetical protein